MKLTLEINLPPAALALLALAAAVLAGGLV